LVIKWLISVGSALLEEAEPLREDVHLISAGIQDHIVAEVTSPQKKFIPPHKRND
jgi:hypothetical protein